MEKVWENWSSFIDTLLETGALLLINPLFYAMVILIFIIFFALYDLPRNRKKMRRSITGLLSYAMKVLWGFLGDILTAIESITNFIDVVRIVLKGKLTEGVQFLLSNYAIIALSVASFATTYNGMMRIVPWYSAALITFGIQVGILSMSSKIAIEWNNRKRQPIKAYRDIAYLTKREPLNGILDGEKKLEVFNSVRSYSWLNDDVNNQKGQTVDGNRAHSWFYIPIHIILLIFSMCASIYFSYVYFFDLAVMPSIPMESYILSINMVTDITNECSQDIANVHSILANNLQKVNQQIRENVDSIYVDMRDTKVSSLQEQINTKTNELNAKREERSQLIGQRETEDEQGNEANAVAINENIVALDEEIEKLEDDIEALEKERDDERKGQYDDESYIENKNVLAALEALESFYVSPLTAISEDGWEGEMTGYLAMLEQFDMGLDEQNKEGKLEKYEKWNTIFSNYVLLCNYYKEQNAEQTYIGMHREVMESALEQEETVLTAYREYTENEDEDGANQILYAESSRILQNLMQELNRIPVLAMWNDMDENEKMEINNLSVATDTSEVYQLFRITTDNVNVLEMVVLKFRMKYIVMSVLMLFLAVFVDGLAVILTLNKSTINFENRLPRYRKLLYKMFIQETATYKEKWKAGLLKWSGGLGVAFGLILFGLYYTVSGHEKSALHQTVSLICLVGLGALISRIILCLYEKSHRNVLEWKQEKLYTALKNGWNLSNQEDKVMQSLRSKIQMACESNTPLQLKNEDMQLIVDLLTSEEECIKALKASARIVFRQIQMVVFNRRTLEYSLYNPGVSAARNYAQGWYDEVDCPCIAVNIIREYGMALDFCVLDSEGLVEYVEIPNDYSDAPKEQYYILTGRFLRILYDLIMEAEAGAEFEDDSYIVDDLLEIDEDNDI